MLNIYDVESMDCFENLIQKATSKHGHCEKDHVSHISLHHVVHSF